MRYPATVPQLFHEAVVDYLGALDVSVDRIAPFAGLHPEQLRRLGKDGKHHTLAPNAITRLIEAPMFLGKSLGLELGDAWEKHLKTASLYTVLVTAAHRRTNSAWPQEPNDYKYVWDNAFDLFVYSGRTLFRENDGSYKTREVQGFSGDSLALWEHWGNNQVETEEDVAATLNAIDKAG